MYVSGSAEKMPLAVTEAFNDIAAKHGVNSASTFVRKLEQSGRYYTEAWS